VKSMAGAHVVLLCLYPGVPAAARKPSSLNDTCQDALVGKSKGMLHSVALATCVSSFISLLEALRWS
jgi:hypothetical protein